MMQAQEIYIIRYFNIEINEPIKKITTDIPNVFDTSLFDQANPVAEADNDIYYLEFELDRGELIHFILLDSIFHKSSTLYFIDLNNNGWVGLIQKIAF